MADASRCAIAASHQCQPYGPPGATCVSGAINSHSKHTLHSVTIHGQISRGRDKEGPTIANNASTPRHIIRMMCQDDPLLAYTAATHLPR
eukprot:scaffold325972_cov54-Tisochrysis_lutea.AAC.2